MTAKVPLKDAAASLGTSPDALRMAIKRGSLKSTKLGRDHYVTLEEISRYDREHRRRAK